MFLGDDASDRICRTDHRSHDPESMRLRSRVDNAEGAHNDVLQKNHSVSQLITRV